MQEAMMTVGAEAVRAQLQLDSTVRYEARWLAAGVGRTVVDYAFFQGNALAAPAAVAKFYSDASGTRAYAAMRALDRALAQHSGARLAIPAALFYDARQRLLVQMRVEGESLDSLARGPRAVEALHLVGLALADLHRLPLPAGQPLHLRAHLADLVRPHPLLLHEHAQNLGPPALALLDALLATEAAIDLPMIAAPIHRDVHLRQLFLGQGRVWLIDWDLFAYGDPALDVGNFSVYLLTHLNAGGAHAVHAFLAGYAEGGGGAALARAPLYAAFTYLRLACKRARLKQPGWSAAAATLLATGLRVLEQQNIYASTQSMQIHSEGTNE